MALKRLITAAAFAALAAPIQAEYKKNSEGDDYTLDLSDYEDPSKLKAAKDAERDLKKAALAKQAELQTALDALTEERDGLLSKSIPKADVETLKNSYETKLKKTTDTLTAEIQAAQTSLQKLLVDNVAQSLATEISTTPTLLMPHIKSRLKAEKGEDGQFKTTVLDKDGKPSALTVKELADEFVLNPDFKAVITGSKASGGGAGGGKGGGGAGAGKVDYSKSPAEVAAALKARGNLKENPNSSVGAE